MATYETFAAVYDAVMDDSLYDLWTDFSLRHLPKTKDKKKLLELACGTGIQSVRFSQAGFGVAGLDLSADMWQVDEERTCGVLTYDVLLEQAGFKSFKLYGDFEDKEPTETSARWFFVAQK